MFLQTYQKYIMSALTIFVLGVLYMSAPQPVIAGAFGTHPGSVTVECLSTNSSNCTWEGTVKFSSNANSKTLYNTTLYTGSEKYSLLEYKGFDGNWTKGHSVYGSPLESGQHIEVPVRVSVPMNALSSSKSVTTSLYADGKVCNENVPTDCYFYGGSTFEVKLEYKQVSAPTPTPVPSPTPATTPVPTTTYKTATTPTPMPKSNTSVQVTGSATPTPSPQNP